MPLCEEKEHIGLGWTAFSKHLAPYHNFLANMLNAVVDSFSNSSRFSRNRNCVIFCFSVKGHRAVCYMKSLGTVALTLLL